MSVNTVLVLLAGLVGRTAIESVATESVKTTGLTGDSGNVGRYLYFFNV